MFAVSIAEAKDPSLLVEIEDFADIVATGSIADRLLPVGVEYAIELEPGKRPPFRPLYYMSPIELKTLREYLK